MRQRASALAELPGLLGEIGVDPAVVFRGTGVDPAELTPDTRLAFGDLHALLDRAAEATGMPDIGLRLGLRFRMAHHGAIGALMETARRSAPSCSGSRAIRAGRSCSCRARAA